jgi:hypothetical protein
MIDVYKIGRAIVLGEMSLAKLVEAFDQTRPKQRKGNARVPVPLTAEKNLTSIR